MYLLYSFCDDAESIEIVAWFFLKSISDDMLFIMYYAKCNEDLADNRFPLMFIRDEDQYGLTIMQKSVVLNNFDG